jgi:D-alanine-D-alanine ligase
MLSRGDDKPPSQRIKRYWKVAVLANIKDDAGPKPEGVPPDAFADFDHIETINAIRAAIETDGHHTVFIQADRDLPYALRDEKPDICFNIAEGLGGDAREAQVPALLEMLRNSALGMSLCAPILNFRCLSNPPERGRVWVWI